MKVVTYESSVRTAACGAAVDLTDEVAAAVRTSGVTDGVACIYSPHARCRLQFAEGTAPPLPPAGGLLPVRGAELQHDSSRRILLVELDRACDRRWLVQVVGR
jgi:thiamine phosphate synthase YjbQ (UPF0047 family)